METRTIGSFDVSVVGLGCNNFGMRIGRAETAAVVDAALDAGINFFDTADIYGGTKSETYLGAALGARRDDIVLATKFGAPYEGHEGGGSAAYIRTAVEDSLTRLGTDRIDLYQLHLPDPKTPIAETIGALVELVAEGKVREIGCSNFTVDMLAEAAAATPDGRPGFVSVQNQYNILTASPRTASWSGARPPGWRSSPSSRWPAGCSAASTGAGQPLPEGTRLAAMGDGAKSQLSDERLAAVADLDELAEREGHSVLDLAFGWLLSRPAVASVIAGATEPEQIAANVAAGTLAPPCRRAGRGRHHRAPLARPVPTARRRPSAGSPTPLRPRPHRGQVHQQVVGDQGDGHVHRHEHQDGLRRLPLMPDVDVGQQKHERHDDGQPEEQPARRRAAARHDRPGRTGDEHPDAPSSLA